MDDRFVLFLDVLGFSQLVGNNSPTDLKQIYDTEFQKAAAASTMFGASIFGRAPNFKVLATADNTLHDVLQDGLNFHVMSDTLIAWTNDDQTESIIQLAQFTATYLAITLTLGLPHRGAISKGSIQLIELPLNGKLQSNVVGTGVVNAHNFESGQEWMGCVVDPDCLNGIELSQRADFPVVEYAIPYNGKEKQTSKYAIDWPRCLKQLATGADFEFFNQKFGRYGKPLEAAEKKIQNSDAFFAAMTKEKPNQNQ